MMAAKTLLLPLLAIAGLVQASPLAARQSEPWTTLPATPKLPSPISSTKASINNAELWFQKYNEAAGGTPVVFIHGGLGYSAYFGDVISAVSKSHYVIAVDRRGHGRSTYGANDKFTFDMFAKDTHDLLAAEGISQALWVGWSDGAATTLAGLLDSTISASISKAFVFAGFQSFADTNTTFTDTAIYQTFVTRCATEYAELQPTANFTDFATKVGTLEATLPTWTDADLAKIDGKKVTISGADHDEAVNLAVPEHLNSVITGSKLVMMTGVSHFAPVQDPAQFAQKIEDFIAA
ncbi:hypothetical protein SLS55_008640 [Diplodia seriata]|uniref:AB hydrolase-1 domain-containing protein n=1 Tax=Diplodia seriata TaxID=420778 RepID=A0ABR3C6K8_9PEZI